MKFLRFLLAAALCLAPSGAQTFWQSRSQVAIPAAGGGSVIQSIQPCVITIAAASLTGTCTLGTSVNTTKTMVVWNGNTTTNASSAQENRTAAYLTVTNGTTITATRGNSSDAITVNCTVVEFASGVNSIQSGNISISGSATGTATLSPTVGANAFALFLGIDVNTAAGNNFLTGSVALTSSSLVTATVINNANTTKVGWMVVDLDTTIVSAVQQLGTTALTSTNTSDNETITSVTTGNASLMWGGVSSQAASGFGLLGYRTQLTGATTVARVRTGAGASSRNIYYTVVTWASGALAATGVQRANSPIVLSAATSGTGAISSVATSKAFVNYTGFTAANAANANVALPTLALTNSTTVTAAVNTAGSPSVGYEVVEFQ